MSKTCPDSRGTRSTGVDPGGLQRRAAGSIAVFAARQEPTHPGEILREDVLPTLRLTVSEAARELGVSRQLLHRILAGKAPVTPEMAVRLGKWAGNGPALWLAMQQAFDVWHAERALSTELARIPGHAA